MSIGRNFDIEPVRVLSIRSDPIRSGPVRTSPIRCDPIRSGPSLSGFCQRPRHFLIQHSKSAPCNRTYSLNPMRMNPQTVIGNCSESSQSRLKSRLQFFFLHSTLFCFFLFVTSSKIFDFEVFSHRNSHYRLFHQIN